jgi:hypothetical protein
MIINIRPLHISPTKAKKCAYVHNPVGGWGGPGKYPHTRQVLSCHITTRITGHVQCSSKKSKHWILFLEWVWGLRMSAHVRRMAYVRARPCRGVGVEMNTPTHSKCSHATLQHISLPCVPFNKILTKQTGRTCWPHSLSLGQKLGMYTSYSGRGKYNSFFSTNVFCFRGK